MLEFDSSELVELLFRELFDELCRQVRLKSSVVE